MPKQENTAEQVEKKLRDELQNMSPPERLQAIMLEISDEADAIKKARQSGAMDDPTVASQRRVVALKEMGNLIVQLEKLGAQVDLSHPICKILMQYMLDLMEKSMLQNGINRSQVDIVFSALLMESKDWEEEVAARYKEYQRERMQAKSSDSGRPKLAAV